MFKSLIVSATLLGTLGAYANTIEVAEDLFTKRGADAENAKKAADIYEALAAQEADTAKKAALMVAQSEALYFYGTRQTSVSMQKTVHKKGEVVGLKAADMLKGDEANKSNRARAIYFYGSNKGKWALAEGGLKPLKLFNKDFKKKMKTLIELDETVDEYGVYRILGLANIKVPDYFPFTGDDKEGERQLRRAFDNTKVETEDYTISTNSTTTRYLLFALMHNKKTDNFCELADSFYAFAEAEREEQDAVNPYLIPETQDEIENFLEPKEGSDQEQIVEYYDNECS